MRLDEDELERWGVRIGEEVDAPVFIGLRGVLGAGKSVLARAIAHGAGVSETMPSPTYNLALRYQTDAGTEVVHLDLYRLEGPEELWELGWSELGAGGEIVLVEWPERAADLLPPDHWIIDLHVPEGAPQLRVVEAHRVGRPPELPAFPLTLASDG